MPFVGFMQELSFASLDKKLRLFAAFAALKRKILSLRFAFQVAFDTPRHGAVGPALIDNSLREIVFGVFKNEPRTGPGDEFEGSCVLARKPRGKKHAALVFVQTHELKSLRLPFLYRAIGAKHRAAGNLCPILVNARPV